MPDSANYEICSVCEVVYRRTFDRLQPEKDWDEIYYSDDRVVDYYLKRRSGFRRIVRLMNDLAPRRGKWLDVGCGFGVLLQVAHESGWEVYGIDQSRVCVAAAGEATRGAHLVQGAIDERLPEFRGLSVVSVHDVLRFVENPGRTLAGLRDALVDGGWLLVREVRAEVERAKRALEPAETAASFDTPLQLWSSQALENGLRHVGFRNVRSIPAPAFTETGRHVRDGRRWLSRELEAIAKRGAWPIARAAHVLTGGRVRVGPNFITLGQK